MQGVFVCMVHSRLHVSRLQAEAGFQNEREANSDHTVHCGQVLVLNYVAYGKMGLHADLLFFFSFAGSHSQSICLALSLCCILYAFMNVLATRYSIRVSYLLANLHQWFSRYTCSPEQNSRAPRENLGTPRLQTDPYDFTR